MKRTFRIVLFVLAFAIHSCHGVKETMPEVKVNDFLDLDTIPAERIFVDTKESFLCVTHPGAANDTVRYKKVNNNALKCKGETDQVLMKSIAQKCFGLSDNDQDIDVLAQKIRANINPTHASSIKEAKLDWPDMVLSVLYNACVGNVRHEQILSIQNSGLLYLGDTFLSQESYSFIDTAAFSSLVKDGLPPFASSAGFLEILKKEGIFVEQSRDFDFCFLDIRGDRIYTGSAAHSFHETGMAAFRDSLAFHPDRIYVKSRDEDGSISEFSSVLPDMNRLVPCQLDTARFSIPSEKGKGEENSNDVHLSKWILGLLLLAILGAVGSLVFFLIFHSKASKPAMDVINELVDRLIAIYQSEEDNRDGDIALYVHLLQNLCGKEFQFNDEFKNADDLIAWKKEYNRKHRYSSVEKVAGQPAVMTEEQKESLVRTLTSLSQDSSIAEILQAFDSELNTCKSSEFEELTESVKKLNAALEENTNLKEMLEKQEPPMKQFNNLTGSKTEEELIGVLKSISKEFKPLPKIDTVKDLVRSLNADDKPSKQIFAILQHIDSVSGSNLHASQASFIKRTLAYDECSKMICGVDSAHDIPTTLKDALFKFVEGGQTVEGAVDFLQQFKPAMPEMKEKEEILRIHNAIENATSSFRDSVRGFSMKGDLNFWDRLAFLLASMSHCAIPILNILEPDNTIEGQKQNILDRIKSDLLLSYVSRYFLRDSKDMKVSAGAFKQDVTNKVSDVVSGFNASVGSEEIKISGQSFNNYLEDNIEILTSSIAKVRGFEASQPFFDGMWDAIVKDFLENANNMDESFIIRQALNIAYHTADFLDHIKGGRDVIYCYNYEFLLHQFNPEESNCREFRHNDFAKSTAYSNFIYELAERYGIKHLKILIDNYFIKP